MTKQTSPDVVIKTGMAGIVFWGGVSAKDC